MQAGDCFPVIDHDRGMAALRLGGAISLTMLVGAAPLVSTVNAMPSCMIAKAWAGKRCLAKVAEKEPALSSMNKW